MHWLRWLADGSIKFKRPEKHVVVCAIGGCLLYLVHHAFHARSARRHSEHERLHLGAELGAIQSLADELSILTDGSGYRLPICARRPDWFRRAIHLDEEDACFSFLVVADRHHPVRDEMPTGDLEPEVVTEPLRERAMRHERVAVGLHAREFEAR